MGLIKWSKGWFAALGFHHAILGILIVLAFSLVDLELFGATLVAGYFMGREEKEMELRNKGAAGMEWLDWITPAILSFGLAYFLG